jgi:serine/threonine-protein kinase HipA
MTHAIPLFYENLPVGTIDAVEGGPVFAYDAAWRERPGAFPISILMPLQAGVVPPSVLVPWLMNLLPEGGALPRLGRNLGVAPQDVLGMVERIGRDTAGALSIGEPRPAGGGGHEPIPSEAALERIIEELPARPFLAGTDGVSMSLAGAQEKLPLAMLDGRLAIPLNGAPSTHILKPDIARLPGSVQNEALCMVLARRVGLLAATITTGKAGARSYLLATRYDRIRRADRTRRLHQEDFCQALGKPPAAKYEHNRTGSKGPGLPDFFGLVRRHMQARDILRLRDAVLLNVLLTNVDAHAKNYSLLLAGGGATLAPLYDLMCAACWPGITQNMAQDIGGKNRGRYVARRHWLRMAAECGINGTALLRQVAALAGRMGAELDPAAAEVRAMPAGGHSDLPAFVAAIRDRCRTVLANLDAAAPEDDPGDADEPLNATDLMAPSGAGGA